MAVTMEELTRIEAALAHDHTADVARLRELFPALRWSRCDASDVTEMPYRRLSAYDLHLLDLSEHCPRVTDEPEQATGILLAARRAS